MIGGDYEPRQIELKVSEFELAAMAEAVYDALIRRVKWTVTKFSAWGKLDYDVVRESIGQLTQAYTTVIFSLRDLPDETLHPQFFDHFAVSPEMWDLINKITYGEAWKDAPDHPAHPAECQVCMEFESV